MKKLSSAAICRLTLFRLMLALVVSLVCFGCVVEETVNGEPKPSSGGFSMSPGIKITRSKHTSETRVIQEDAPVVDPVPTPAVP